jgi:hypothetical protein
MSKSVVRPAVTLSTAKPRGHRLSADIGGNTPWGAEGCFGAFTGFSIRLTVFLVLLNLCWVQVFIEFNKFKAMLKQWFDLAVTPMKLLPL